MCNHVSMSDCLVMSGANTADHAWPLWPDPGGGEQVITGS